MKFSIQTARSALERIVNSASSGKADAPKAGSSQTALATGVLEPNGKSAKTKSATRKFRAAIETIRPSRSGSTEDVALEPRISVDSTGDPARQEINDAEKLNDETAVYKLLNDIVTYDKYHASATSKISNMAFKPNHVLGVERFEGSASRTPGQTAALIVQKVNDLQKKGASSAMTEKVLETVLGKIDFSVPQRQIAALGNSPKEVIGQILQTAARQLAASESPETVQISLNAISSALAKQGASAEILAKHRDSIFLDCNSSLIENSIKGDVNSIRRFLQIYSSTINSDHEPIGRMADFLVERGADDAKVLGQLKALIKPPKRKPPSSVAKTESLSSPPATTDGAALKVSDSPGSTPSTQSKENGKSDAGQGRASTIISLGDQADSRTIAALRNKQSLGLPLKVGEAVLLRTEDQKRKKEEITQDYMYEFEAEAANLLKSITPQNGPARTGSSES